MKRSYLRMDRPSYSGTSSHLKTRRSTYIIPRRLFARHRETHAVNINQGAASVHNCTAANRNGFTAFHSLFAHPQCLLIRLKIIQHLDMVIADVTSQTGSEMWHRCLTKATEQAIADDRDWKCTNRSCVEQWNVSLHINFSQDIKELHRDWPISFGWVVTTFIGVQNGGRTYLVSKNPWVDLDLLEGRRNSHRPSRIDSWVVHFLVATSPKNSRGPNERSKWHHFAWT